jgi:hypothetical protein
MSIFSIPVRGYSRLRHQLARDAQLRTPPPPTLPRLQCLAMAPEPRLEPIAVSAAAWPSDKAAKPR